MTMDSNSTFVADACDACGTLFPLGANGTADHIRFVGHGTGIEIHCFVCKTCSPSMLIPGSPLKIEAVASGLLRQDLLRVEWRQC